MGKCRHMTKVNLSWSVKTYLSEVIWLLRLSFSLLNCVVKRCQHCTSETFIMTNERNNICSFSCKFPDGNNASWTIILTLFCLYFWCVTSFAFDTLFTALAEDWTHITPHWLHILPLERLLRDFFLLIPKLSNFISCFHTLTSNPGIH